MQSSSSKYKISSPLPYNEQPAQSPARPVRSRMRDNPEASPPSPARPARTLRPIQTQLRRPSDAISPIETSPTAFQDPFAQDRSQRVQALAVTRQQAAPSDNNKLRNVVGAFMSASTRDDPRRPGKSEARRRPTRQEAWDVSGEGKFVAVDNVLVNIKKEWPFVLESDFSPSSLALSLLSKSNSHPSLSAFLRLHDALSASLQTAVQAHFQSFAASLPAHAQFITTLSTAQDQVRSSRDSLKEARDGFAGKGKSELAGVRARERTVRDMLRLLDTM